VAFLSRSRWWILGVALAAAGCAVFAWRTASDRPAFPHVLHGADLGLDCEICHTTATTGADAGRPPLDGCLLCHDAIDPDKAPARRAAALFDEVGAYLAAPLSRLDDEIRFAHDAHAAAGIGCAECHGDVAATEALSGSVRVTKDACLRCHAERQVSNDCQVCHTRMGRDVAPTTHVAGWRQHHGTPVRGHSGAIADRCEMCHQPSACTGCHATEEPRSHTHQFREVGHGLEAMVDRDRCSVCHTSSSCIQCHQETAPRSHRARWGAPRNEHCLGCHQGPAEGGCKTCHPGTPSHAMATPMPSSPVHSPALNCRQCHGMGQALPHVDNGSECTQCHK
jgi:hypothetical protein